MTLKYARKIVMPWMLLILLACSKDVTPPEQLILQLNRDAEAAAEAKDLGALKDMVADDFKSDHLDKNAILRLVQLYMLGHKSIHLFSLTRSVQIVNEESAVAEIVVAMAGKPIERADQLFDLSADLLHFAVTYARRDDEWAVMGVKWRRAEVDDFLN